MVHFRFSPSKLNRTASYRRDGRHVGDGRLPDAVRNLDSALRATPRRASSESTWSRRPLGMLVTPTSFVSRSMVKLVDEPSL